MAYIIKLPSVLERHIDFTFGIITAGGADANIERIVKSIKGQNIPNYEILIVGETCVKGEYIRVIPFDEAIKPAWITKKKNSIAQEAKYENIVLLHDYVELCPGWYKGFLMFGNDFKICVNKITNLSGKRFRDFCLFKEFLPTDSTLLPYSSKLSPSLSKLVYLSGTYYVVKREIASRYPLDERLSWNQGEDVLFSQALSKDGILFKCNPFSTVSLLKEKELFEREMSQEVYEELCSWANTFGEATFQRQCQFQESWTSQFFNKYQYISIGGWCGPRMALDELKIINEPHNIFDHIRSSSKGIIDCIKNDFSNFIPKDKTLDTRFKNKNWHPCIGEHFGFYHSGNLSQASPLGSIERKQKRFIEHCTSGRQCIFIRTCVIPDYEEELSDMNIIYEELHKKYPMLSFKIVFVIPDQPMTQYYKSIDDRIFIFCLNEGEGYKKIFDFISLKKSLPPNESIHILRPSTNLCLVDDIAAVKYFEKYTK